MEKTGPKVRPLRSPGRPGPSARLCLGHQGLCGTRGAQSGSDTPSKGLCVPPFCSSAGTPARDPGALGAWKQNPEDTSCPEARASSKPRLLPQRRAPWGPCHVGGGVRGPRPCLGRPSAPSPTADGRLPEALVHHGRPQAHVLQRPPGKDGRTRAPGWTEGLPAGRGGGGGGGPEPPLSLAAPRTPSPAGRSSSAAGRAATRCWTGSRRPPRATTGRTASRSSRPSAASCWPVRRSRSSGPGWRPSARWWTGPCCRRSTQVRRRGGRGLGPGPRRGPDQTLRPSAVEAHFKHKP